MNTKATIRARIRELNAIDVRCLHDVEADTFYLEEMRSDIKIGRYTRGEFLGRWCGIESYLLAPAEGC